MGSLSDAQRLKREALKFLQEYYGGTPADFKFKWTPNIRTTKIIIADQHAINLGSIQQTPAITASRGPVSLDNKTLGQMSHIDYFTSTIRYLGTYNVQIQFNCQSIQGLVAEELAEHTFDVFLHYNEMCWKHTVEGLNHVFPLTIGTESIQKADSGPDIISVPIVIGFELSKAWSVTNKGPFLEDIQVLPPIEEE